MYHRAGSTLCTGVTNGLPFQRIGAWADAQDLGVPDDLCDEAVLAGVRSAMAAPVPNEVGAWSLEYLGPGFHVQLRIARRNRQARVDGWMSPAQPIKILLSSLLRHPIVLETHVSESGRFEFPAAPTGACRMSFVTDRGRPPATPPFWI